MRARMVTVFNVGTVQLIQDGDVPAAPTWRVTKDDGAGPIPAAEAVLGGYGWRVVGGWQQCAGGISGGVWEADVEPG